MTTEEVGGSVRQDTYNGWSNYETWCANLWLSNEYGVTERITWELQDVISSYEMDYAKGESVLESFVTGEVLAPYEGDTPLAEGVCDMALDLLNASISRINWREIATAWMDELAEDGDA
jgi:hypothetical protein